MEHVVARQHPQNCVIEHLRCGTDVLEREEGEAEREDRREREGRREG